MSEEIAKQRHPLKPIKTNWPNNVISVIYQMEVCGKPPVFRPRRGSFSLAFKLIFN